MIPAAMKNPFLLALMVVSLAGAQQLQQRGFVGGQGRPGAAALLQQQRGGGGASVGVRTTQQQPAFRPVPRAQVPQRVTQQSINTQQRAAPLANPQVANQVSPVAPNPIPQQQQQAINVQQRTVQIPAAQPQQVSVNQQRPLQAIRLQQKPVAQRVVQIPAGSPKPVPLSQQRVAQTAIPQQQVIAAQQQDVQIPFAQQQQQFASPITTNREFPQIAPQEATLEDNVNTGFAQDGFRPQENAGVSQGILRQSPQPVQRKKVRKQKVKTITGNFPRELTEDEQEDQREWEEILAEQARNAKYSYSSTVEDGLNDQLVSRQETRDGLLTTGSYSYSDGFFQRTIHYEADENGFRVTRQEIEAIGDGPQPDPNGSAHVTSEFGSARNEYAITAADLAPPAPLEESITGSI